MAYARLYPEGKIGRPSKSEKVDSVNLFDKAYLSRARYVLKHDDLANLVMTGLSLNAAYEAAKKRDFDREAWDVTGHVPPCGLQAVGLGA